MAEDERFNERGITREPELTTPVKRGNTSGEIREKKNGDIQSSINSRYNLVPKLTPISKSSKFSSTGRESRNKITGYCDMLTPLKPHKVDTPTKPVQKTITPPTLIKRARKKVIEKQSPFKSNRSPIPQLVRKGTNNRDGNQKPSDEVMVPLSSPGILQMLNQKTPVSPIFSKNPNGWSPSPKKARIYHKKGGLSERIQELASNEEDMQEMRNLHRKTKNSVKSKDRSNHYLITELTRLNRFCYQVELDDGRGCLLVDVSERRNPRVGKSILLGPLYMDFISNDNECIETYMKWELETTE